MAGGMLELDELDRGGGEGGGGSWTSGHEGVVVVEIKTKTRHGTLRESRHLS